MAAKTHRVLPGFGLALGYTLVYLSLLILLPSAALLGTAVCIAAATFKKYL